MVNLFFNIYGHLLVTGYIICCIIVLQKKCAHFLEHFFTQQILWYIYIFFLVHSQLTYYRKKNLNQLPSPTDWKIERKKQSFC